MRRGLALASMIVFAFACSRTRAIDHQQLASEQKRLQSLDSESWLFEQMLIRGRTTRAYARGHAAYLHRAAREIAQQLAQARPAPGAEREFQQVSADATRLEQRFVALLLRVQ